MSEGEEVERFEVARFVPYPAGEVFAVLRDPTGHVEIDSSGMLQSSTGDPVSAVGDTFEIHMDRESLNDYPLGKYDVTIEIITYEPDREIAWLVRGRLDLGHSYGYRLEPAVVTTEAGEVAGTTVTSYYDWSAVAPEWKTGVFPVLPEAALRATLGILERTVRRRLER